MRIVIFSCFILLTTSVHSADSLQLSIDSVIVEAVIHTDSPINQINIFDKRLKLLDENTPMDLGYNEKVQPFIDNYL
jgi:hypothetical protein